MPRWFRKSFQALLLVMLPLGVQAQTTVLQAVSDFTNIDSGEVPYYVEIANGRNALAINAANETYRGKFARAEHEFLNTEGIYDITIHALGEIDGDGPYRLLVNDVVQGEVVNSPVETDYTVIEHTFAGIALSPQDVIAVESMAVSNNQVVEGDGYAFARGRWRAVSLTLSDASAAVSDLPVDLSISLSTVATQTTQNDLIPAVASVFNSSSSTTATGVLVEFALPDGIAFHSSDSCTATSDGAVCELAEIGPGAVSNVRINVEMSTVGWHGITGSVGGDQPEPNTQNNVSSLVLNVAAQTANEATNVDTSNTGNGNNSVTPTNTSDNVVLAGANQDDTVGGLFGIQALLGLCLFGFVRIRTKAKLG